MLTEAEAMKKRCYRDLSSDCVGSMCMAWRWDRDPYDYCTMDNRCRDPKREGWLTHTDGPPPAPSGEGWEPCSEPKQKDGFVAGVLEQVWRRPNKYRTGVCGMSHR